MYIELNSKIIKISNNIIAVSIMYDRIYITYTSGFSIEIPYSNQERQTEDYNKIKKILMETNFDLQEIDP